MRLSRESYNRSNIAGDNYNFGESDRQLSRGQSLRDAARRYARLGGVTTDDRGYMTGGQWNRKGTGLSNG